MKTKNTNSPIVISRLRHINLLHYFDDNNRKKYLGNLKKQLSDDFEDNRLVKFIEIAFSMSKTILKKYSSRFSRKDYNLPALFTIICLKIRLKMTYRGIAEHAELLKGLKGYLSIKKIPHYSTLQKFFKRMPSDMFEKITKKITAELEINPETIMLDGSGFSSDFADQYYATIRGNCRKKYTKGHIAVDLDSRLILHGQALNGARHDTKFAIPSIRAVKRYKPSYILADKAYDTEPIRKCIKKELGAIEQIPLKKNFQRGWHRRLSKKTFNKKIYNKRSQVEGVYSALKRKLSGILRSRNTRLKNKETKLKMLVYNIDQTIILCRK